MDYTPIDFDFKKFLNRKELRRLENVILHVLRGKLSQARISEKLNHSFNIYGKWENGSKILMWHDLVSVAVFRKISIAVFLSDNYKILGSEKDADAYTIIRHFFKSYFNQNYTAMAKFLGINATKMRRLVKVASPAPASLILKLLSYRPQHFLNLLEKLNVADHFIELKRELERIKSLSNTLSSSPINTAVLYFLDTSEYKKLRSHNSELIARRLYLDVSQVDTAINVLIKNGSISLDGKKYKNTNSSHEFSTADYKDTIPLFNYWLYRLAGNINNKLLTNNAKSEIPTSYSYRVMSVSRKTVEQINLKVRELYHEIIQLEKESDDNDVVVRVVMLNHFGLDECAGFPLESDKDRGLFVKKWD